VVLVAIVTANLQPDRKSNEYFFKALFRHSTRNSHVTLVELTSDWTKFNKFRIQKLLKNWGFSRCLLGPCHLTTYQRRQFLLDMLRKQPGLRVPEMAIALGVSECTVRNNLNALEEKGRLQRVHVGAILKTSDQLKIDSFMRRYRQNESVKLTTAREAAQVI
jgi:Fic family protein